MKLEDATLDQIVEELKTRFEYFAITGDLGDEGVYRQWYTRNEPLKLVGLVNLLDQAISLNYLSIETEIEDDEPWKNN